VGVRRVGAVLLTETCAGCGGPGRSPCPRCLVHLHRPRIVPADLVGLDVAHALLVYEGPGRELVARLKYRNDRRVLAWLADGMAALLAPPPGTLVTWIPTTAPRRRRRGFDQAELLARAVARRWHVPCHDLLARHRAVPQTGRSLVERQRGVPLAVRSRAGRITRPVVLADDVVTTGASLRSGAEALRAAGVPWIAGLAAAATPRRRR
jgi:predicted amidophosphoribosyltransferase